MKWIHRMVQQSTESAHVLLGCPEHVEEEWRDLIVDSFRSVSHAARYKELTPSVKDFVFANPVNSRRASSW
jgi:hypothetical protein